MVHSRADVGRIPGDFSGQVYLFTWNRNQEASRHHSSYVSSGYYGDTYETWQRARVSRFDLQGLVEEMIGEVLL